jgi:methylenetetrahydrofolate reductase (NADPH)
MSVSSLRRSRTGETPALRVSFEFFPPKSEEMEEALWGSIKRLEPLSPHFVSVTYGAGGSTRERTHATVARIVSETTLKPAAHLTCVSATREQVREVVRDYWAAGVRHIVALRGDPAGGLGSAYAPKAGDFRLGLSGASPREPVAGRRYRYVEAQGRCGRHARHHAVLLR